MGGMSCLSDTNNSPESIRKQHITNIYQKDNFFGTQYMVLPFTWANRLLTINSESIVHFLLLPWPSSLLSIFFIKHEIPLYCSFSSVMTLQSIVDFLHSWPSSLLLIFFIHDLPVHCSFSSLTMKSLQSIVHFLHLSWPSCLIVFIYHEIPLYCSFSFSMTLQSIAPGDME